MQINKFIVGFVEFANELPAQFNRIRLSEERYLCSTNIFSSTLASWYIYDIIADIYKMLD